MKGTKEICICAAVKSKDGEIFRGHRHGDCFRAILERGKEICGGYHAQGFITSKNRFVGREEGRRLQDEAKVKSASLEGYVGNTLFSEDLY